MPAGAASLGIDDHVTVFQELIGNLNSRLQEAAAIVLEVEDKAFHAILLQ